MENLIVASHSHSHCWTDEWVHNTTGLASIVDLLERRPSEFIVNRMVLDRPCLRERLVR
jgi:hypothetical protein